MLQTPKDHSDWRKLEEAVSDHWNFLIKLKDSSHRYFELVWPRQSFESCRTAK